MALSESEQGTTNQHWPERTDFILEGDTEVLIATRPGFVGNHMTDSETILLTTPFSETRTEYRIVGSRHRLETDTHARVSGCVQEILIRKIRKPWYTMLSDGWQTAIGFTIATILLLPFIYYFFMIPLIGSVIAAQLESRGLVVRDDANRTIVQKDVQGTQKTLDPYQTFKIEQQIRCKAFVSRYAVPAVPWILFVFFGVVLPIALVKRLGGKYYQDNQVLRSFFTLLGMTAGIAAVRYWNLLARPPSPLVAWPTDFADHFDFLQQRMATFWPIVAAWVIPLGAALLKLTGLDALGQLIEKIAGRKK